jgi:pimeloyl-ACP methyl ester carboxylesterase
MVIWAHGLEGAPNGRKANALREAGFELIAPDGRKKALIDRLPALIEAIEANPGALLVGSSYGGLASAYLAGIHGSSLRGVVLLAPALHWNEAPIDDASALQIPQTLPCTVIHGVNDAVVPVAVSRQLAQHCPHVRLIEVEDGHSLSGSLDVMIQVVGGHLSR